MDADGKVGTLAFLSDLELIDVDTVRRQEGDADFRGHDEDFLIKQGEADRCLDRARELGRSRRIRARRRGLEERADAARGVVEHRRHDLDEASRLLTDARRDLAPVAARRLSDRTYRRRKLILAVGEAVSLAVAFSAAFDVAPAEAILLSGAIALAFVVAGDFGGILRLSVDRARLSSALAQDAVALDPKYLHLVVHDRRRWLTVVGCAAAGVFALAAVSVGLLRAANRDSFGLAAGLALLTVTMAMAAGLSSWQHASIGGEVIDHLRREEEAAARRWRRAARARVLRRYDALGEKVDVRWRAAEERGTARQRQAEAHCGYFRARHPHVFGHGVRLPGSAVAPKANVNGALNGWAANGNGRVEHHPT
jgi:hypothetical protein